MNEDHFTRTEEQAYYNFWAMRGWYEISCGCSSGLQWGGEYPTECYTCKGRGMLWVKVSNVNAYNTLALYPGGPFAGKTDEDPSKHQKLFY